MRRISIAVITAILVAATGPLLAEEGAKHEGHEHGHEQKWTTLFDGKTLKGWRGYKQKEVRGWVVKDGTLYRNDKGGDIMTTEKYDNYELQLEWKVAPGANSGIMYRVRTGDGAPYMSGVEYQVLDNDKHHDGKSELTAAGSLYAMYPSDKKVVKPVGEWNKTRIILDGNHVEHWLNGKKLVSTEMWGDDWNKRFNKSKFKGWKQFGREKTGHIALQDHGDPVWFRNIKIRPVQKGDHGKHDHVEEHDHSKESKAKADK